MAQPPITQGLRDLFSALGGRRQIRQAAEADAWKSADDRVKAELLADELMSRRGLGSAYTGLGIENGNDLATVSRAGFANFPQATEGLKDLADLALQRNAVGLATADNPDVAKLNRILASRSQGGGPLSPQEASVVPLGDALVNRQRTQSQVDMARTGTLGAQGRSYDAQALAAQALAELRGRTDPNLRSVGNKSRLVSGGGPNAPLPTNVGVPSWLVPQGAPALPAAPSREGTAEEDLRAIEQDLGAALTPDQRQQFVTTGRLDIQPSAPDFRDVIATKMTTEDFGPAMLPPQAQAKLKEGRETRFSNGQVWSIRDGVPTRLK